jgi:molecular chaperone HscB
MDPFATLGIERTFDIDLAAVEKTHRELSRTLHPDKHAKGGATERRYALSKAIEVNEAWRIVRDPIRRAEALFQLAGIPVGETREPKPSSVLLMDMMEQREALEDARASRDSAAVKSLAVAIEARAKSTEKALSEGFRAQGRLEELVHCLGELRFYRRFLDEVSEADELEEPAATSTSASSSSHAAGR